VNISPQAVESLNKSLTASERARLEASGFKIKADISATEIIKD
jgi:hypothetical protein